MLTTYLPDLPFQRLLCEIFLVVNYHISFSEDLRVVSRCKLSFPPDYLPIWDGGWIYCIKFVGRKKVAASYIPIATRLTDCTDLCSLAEGNILSKRYPLLLIIAAFWRHECLN